MAILAVPREVILAVPREVILAVIGACWAFRSVARERGSATGPRRRYDCVLRDPTAMTDTSPRPGPPRSWSELLSGFTAPTGLVVDRAVERGQVAHGQGQRRESLRRALGPRASKALAGPGRRELLEAALGLLLARYTGEEFALFGVREADTRGSDAVLPARVDPSWSRTAGEYLAEVAAARAARARLPLPAADELRAAASIPARLTLFEAVLVLEELDTEVGGGLPDPELPWGRAPLVVMALAPGEEAGRWSLAAIRAAERLEAAPAERLLGHLEVLLEGLADSSNQAIGSLPLLTEQERRVVLRDFNATAVDFPDGATLHGLFEARVDRDSGALAVVAGDARLTYGELEERANRLANHLRALGVGPDVPVGISLGRGAEMVVGLVAIAKAGGGYVPLDPTYPAERLAFLLGDSAVPVLVTEERLLGLFSAAGADTRVVCVDRDRADIAAASAARPASGAGPEHLAYLIYTSGSTGAPKGVWLNHRGRVNNFADFNRRYDVGPGDRLLGLASMSFDMCAYDVFGTLAAGAALVVGDTAALEPGTWARLMVEHEVTLWHSVPALLEMLVGHVEGRTELRPRTLRLVLLGGDWIPVGLPDRVKAVGHGAMRVISMGGATECSMDSTIFEIERTDPDWKSIPYGAPMWNQRAYVLDWNRQPVPIGVPAELWLGGVGVGRGYHARPELSAEKFADDPFVEGDSGGGGGRFAGEARARMYKTGDLVRWKPDGNLELLGRMDFQVKIRGFRIELGEIESTLREHAAVREAVVVAREDGGREKRLVAYVLRDEAWRPASEAGAGSAEQVARWAAVYDSAYQRAEAGAGRTTGRDSGTRSDAAAEGPGEGRDGKDPTFNIRSWDSSYTAGPIPAPEMHEWVDRIVERIESLAPRRVLEIGCGTGLLLFRLAPNCERYVGTDISTVALDHVRHHAAERGLKQVELLQRGGDDFAGLEPDSLDAVVLNSIVMDFPSPGYLVEVLEGAARVVRPGGFIFVGDVRNRETLELFAASVQLHRSPSGWSTEQLRQSIFKQIEMEEELVIDPAFFAAFGERNERIGHVEVAVKRGRYPNEMVRFRYNATLFVGGESPRFVGERVDWSEAGLSLEGLRERLERDRPAQLALVEVPNARTTVDVAMLERMKCDGAPDSVGELRTERDALAAAAPGVQPEDLWELADELGYAADVRFAASGRHDRCDAVLVRRDPARAAAAGAVRLPFGPATDPGAPLVSYFNDPLGSHLSGALSPALRSFLGERLPPYMVPAGFVFLEQFPLSPNGKINRRALPAPDRLRPELEDEYVAPRSALEAVLCGIWSEGLGLDRVGVRDGFVALGGNSLLATQLVSRVRDVFGLDVPLKSCLNLNLEQLAERLAELGRAEGVELEEVAQVVQQIDSMSEAEVQSLLESESVSGGEAQRS